MSGGRTQLRKRSKKMMRRLQESGMTRRAFLTSTVTAIGGGILMTALPSSAEAAEARGYAAGNYQDFSFYGITGGMMCGLDYVPYSWLKNTGAVSSRSHTFGAGSMQGFLSIKGPQRVICDGYFTNSTSGKTVSVSLTTYDVNGGDGGYFYGTFYPSLYRGGHGFVPLGVHSSAYCSMYNPYDLSNIPQPSQAITLSDTPMLPRTGDSGIDGFVRAEDLTPPNFSSPEACIEFYQTHNAIEITVYDDDGVTPVDILSIPCLII